MIRTLFPLTLMLLVTACAGTTAREEVTMPAARTAYTSVYADVARGIADGVEDGELNQTQADALTAQAEALRLALALEEIDDIVPAVNAAAWPVLRPWADRGIADRVEDGEIGPGVASSFNERVANFTDAINTITKGG